MKNIPIDTSGQTHKFTSFPETHQDEETDDVNYTKNIDFKI